MAKLNVKSPSIHTHEGAVAKRINPVQQLERSIMACMLWESQFYEGGVTIADRIESLVPKVGMLDTYTIAKKARTHMNLRHAPLLVAAAACKAYAGDSRIKEMINDIILRPDELTELVAIYWKNGKRPLSGQLKKGLAKAFTKFNEYQLAKYNRDSAIKLRDVLFLSHAKPKDEAQTALWKKLVDGQLQPPDTWEVALSAGKDKKETFERLIRERKLGAMALLRNLRNCIKSNVDMNIVKDALENMKTDRILPFRFIAAAKHAPMLESTLQQTMLKNVASHEKLPGKTVLLVDVSGSMTSGISGKSDMSRMDAACGLAVLVREICDDVRILSFSDYIKEIPDRRGFALRDALLHSQPHCGTELGKAVRKANALACDRVIAITDEQSRDPVPNPTGRGYMLNVASYRNGVGYGKWTHIDGWSEAIVDYIAMYEKEAVQ